MKKQKSRKPAPRRKPIKKVAAQRLQEWRRQQNLEIAKKGDWLEAGIRADRARMPAAIREELDALEALDPEEETPEAERLNEILEEYDSKASEEEIQAQLEAMQRESLAGR